MDGFLTKPIVIEELMDILQKNLDQVSGELFDGEIPFGCMDSEHFIALINNFILFNASD